MELTHKHWIIVAFDEKINGDFINAVFLDYIANSFDEALVKAKRDYKPNLRANSGGYALRNVIEHFGEVCSR